MSCSMKPGAGQALEPSVICRHCLHKFCSIVSFKVDDTLDFQLGLFRNREDQPPFVNQTFVCTEQDDLEQKCSVKCPACKEKFELSVCLTVTTTESQLKINLSISTFEAEKKEKGKKAKDKPSQRRVKVFYKCSGETFRSDDQVKQQLMVDKRRTLHVQETNLKDSDVVIVFCPITSRVGSDVESTMRDEMVSSSNKPIILVLMHHTRDFEYSTAGTIWSEVHPNVVLDVHVLFHETKPGLLNCLQNNLAIKAIEQKLNDYSTQILFSIF